MITESEYFWRRLYGSILIVCAFGSGVAGLYLQPLFVGVMVYTAVARKRYVAFDAVLFMIATVMMFVSAKYIGPAPFSDWSVMIPAFDWADLLSWMFIGLIVAKTVLFAGSAAALYSDVRHIRLGARG